MFLFIVNSILSLFSFGFKSSLRNKDFGKPLLSKEVRLEGAAYEYHGFITPILGFVESDSALVTNAIVITTILFILSIAAVVWFWFFVKRPLSGRTPSDDTTDNQLSTFLTLA